MAIGGAAAVLVATVPASAFNSGSDPSTYYNRVVSGIEAHRGWQNTEGVAFEPVGAFTQRLPDDEFDDILLNLVNWYRGDNGLPALEQFEPLRAQSAIRSNLLADRATLDLEDKWYAGDAFAACNPVSDVFSISAQSTGKPEDVYYQWLVDPAARNAILVHDPGAVGIATVTQDSQSYTTMRIVQGSCPGSGMPFRVEPSGLPKPTLRAATLPDGEGLTVSVQRRGDSQQLVEVQQADGWRWVKWKDFFLQPGTRQLRVFPPAGQYRVVIPRQSGYDFALTGVLEVAGPPAQ